MSGSILYSFYIGDAKVGNIIKKFKFRNRNLRLTIPADMVDGAASAVMRGMDSGEGFFCCFKCEL